MLLVLWGIISPYYPVGLSPITGNSSRSMPPSSKCKMRSQWMLKTDSNKGVPILECLIEPGQSFLESTLYEVFEGDGIHYRE
jgi:hypothetical protein